ncbi:MAG: hypothetical protein Q7J39_00560 [Phenylobacterium sp.]|nr:hypothetical protein [Phenylobacterium sp.]MDO8798805.1 hypothetical protein [Phenylobacterium sp.]
MEAVYQEALSIEFEARGYRSPLLGL